eukprot:2222370-Prymnesium_polylepis.1
MSQLRRGARWCSPFFRGSRTSPRATIGCSHFPRAAVPVSTVTVEAVFVPTNIKFARMVRVPWTLVSTGAVEASFPTTTSDLRAR